MSLKVMPSTVLTQPSTPHVLSLNGSAHAISEGGVPPDEELLPGEDDDDVDEDADDEELTDDSVAPLDSPPELDELRHRLPLP